MTRERTRTPKPTNGWNVTAFLHWNAGRKARNSGTTYLALGALLIPSAIVKVLSTIQKHGARALLMGGQACVFYGAAAFSPDIDVLVLAEATISPGSRPRS